MFIRSLQCKEILCEFWNGVGNMQSLQNISIWVVLFFYERIFCYLQNGMNGTNGKSSTSQQGHKPWESYERFEETPLYIAVLTYLGYAILIVVGHLRDLLRRWNIERLPMASEPVKPVNLSFLWFMHIISFFFLLKLSMVKHLIRWY